MYLKFLKPIVEHSSDRLVVVGDRGSGKTTNAKARYDFLESRHASENLRMLYVTNTLADVYRLRREDVNDELRPFPRNYLSVYWLRETFLRGTNNSDDVVIVFDQITNKDHTWLVDDVKHSELRLTWKELELMRNIVSVTVFSDPGVLVPEDWSIQRILIENDDYITKTYTQVY